MSFVSLDTRLFAAALQWQSPQMLAGALLVGGAIVIAVLLLYPSQVRSLPPAWRWALPGLRCLAMVLLAGALARPVAQRAMSEEEQGAYAVLVDDSRSMASVDARSPAALVALADGMGLLPENQRTRADEFAAIEQAVERLSTLFDTITQAQIDLDYAALQGRDNPAARQRFESATGQFTAQINDLAKLRDRFRQKSKRFSDAVDALRKLPKVDDDDWQDRAGKAIAELTAPAGQFQVEADNELYGKNAQVRQVCDELAKLSRFELAERAVVDEKGGLLSKLPEKSPLYGYTIGSSARSLGLRGRGRNVRRLLVSPDEPASNLTGGLRQVLDGLRHQKLRGDVLFTDGRQVGEEAEIASSLAGGEVPVYTVLTAPQPPAAPVRDVAIARVEMPSPPNTFVGESMNVTAHVVWTAGMAAPGEVALQIGAYQLRAPVEGRERGADGLSRGVARFTVQFDEPGPQRITLSVKGDKRELTDANNSVDRWVKVLSDRFEVLLVGGEPSWDYRYLRDALSRTRWVNLRYALLDGDDARLAVAADHIASSDVIILWDAPAKGLSPEQWDAVRRVVVQRGGSVILVAGPDHLPREYTGAFLSEFLPYKRAAALGSASLWRTWPGEEPEFRFVPAPGVADADRDLLLLADDPSESWYRWNAMPPVFRYFAIPDLKEAARALLVERDTRAPVLTRQRLGRGKVFFLGLDETWRWRSRSGDRDQDRFFRQLVRAAADEPYAASNGLLSLDADQVVIRPGESVRVRARVVDPGAETWAWGTPAPGSSIDLDILRDGAVVRTESLPAVGEAGSGRFEGRVGGLEGGKYVLRLRAPYATGVEYPLHVSENYEQEMLNLTGDAELLRRLAKSSGGEFRSLETFGDVPGLLAEARKRAPRWAELRLWDSWYLYAVVVSALGMEWALRKRFGLA